MTTHTRSRTYRNRRSPATGEKRRKAAGWRQKAVLVLNGLVSGAALVAGGFALAGDRSANLAPLPGQVRTLQAREYALHALVTGDAGKSGGNEDAISRLRPANTAS